MSKGNRPLSRLDISANLIANGPPEIKEAWLECEQLKKAVLKNNGMKKNIAKRLRHNEREAEKFREELSTKITGEDRRELMELQYQVGRLELENMELEQHRIVHESILKGKDLVIQKLTLQLAVRDKLIQRQQFVLKEHEVDDKVGYSQLALMEQALVGGDGGDEQAEHGIVPSSPLRNISEMMPKSLSLIPSLDMDGGPGNVWNGDDDELDIRELSLTSLDKNSMEAGDWSEIQCEVSDSSFRSPNENRNSGNKNKHKEDKNYQNQGFVLDTVLEGSGEHSLTVSPTNGKGGIRAPRVGRKYRSSFENLQDAENGDKQPLRPSNKKNQGHNDDDGSNQPQRLNSADRLEPINRGGPANIDDFKDDSRQDLYIGNRPKANNQQHGNNPHASVYPMDSNSDGKPNRMAFKSESKNDLFQRPTDRFKGDKESNHGPNSIRTGGNSILNNGDNNEKVDENLSIRGKNNNNNKKPKQWVSASESESKNDNQRPNNNNNNNKRNSHQNHQEEDNDKEIQPFEFKQQPHPSRNYQQQQQQLIDRQQGGLVIANEQSHNRQSNPSNPYQQQKRNVRQNEEIVEDIGDNLNDNIYSEDEYSEGGRGKKNGLRFQQGNHQGQGQGQQKFYQQGDNNGNDYDENNNNGGNRKKVLGKLKNRLSNASGNNIPPPGNGPAINIGVGNNNNNNNNNNNIERPQKAIPQPVVNQNSNQNNGGFGGPGQILAPVLAPGAAGIEKGIGGIGLAGIGLSKKPNQRNDEGKKKKIINADKNSTSNSDGGQNHNGGNNDNQNRNNNNNNNNNPNVPSIGGRNRSLPNLPKNGGSNSARSQPGNFR
jgi:hypothetical protein